MHLGAKVHKIESIQGDWLKNLDDGIHYHQLNAGKEIHIVDFRSSTSKTFLTTLIAKADIVLEQFRPGVMKALGYDYDTCAKINSNLIYVSLSGYGQNGTMANKPGHDLNYLAEAGVLSLLRNRAGEPILPSIQIADVSAAFQTVNACLCGLLQRSLTGAGCYIDLSIVDSIKPFLWFGESLDKSTTFQFLSGHLVNYNLYQSSDGKWFALGALELKFWNRFCELIQKPEWKRDELRELLVDKFDQNQVIALFQSKNSGYWLDLSDREEICLSPVVDAGNHQTSSGIF